MTSTSLSGCAAHNRILSKRERVDGQNERSKEYYRKSRDYDSAQAMYRSGGMDGLRPESRLSGLCGFRVSGDSRSQPSDDRLYRCDCKYKLLNSKLHSPPTCF